MIQFLNQMLPVPLGINTSLDLDVEYANYVCRKNLYTHIIQSYSSTKGSQ